jgi:hypothetical protein
MAIGVDEVATLHFHAVNGDGNAELEHMHIGVRRRYRPSAQGDCSPPRREPIRITTEYGTNADGAAAPAGCQRRDALCYWQSFGGR